MGKKKIKYEKPQSKSIGEAATVLGAGCSPGSDTGSICDNGNSNAMYCYIGDSPGVECIIGEGPPEG